MESQTNLATGRKYYKPHKYLEFYDRWKLHERGHWLPSEVSMHDDVNDWNNNLDASQKKFLTNIFRFFTQGDVDVAGAYCTEYLPNFSQTPEIAMFMCSVAAREAIHIDAYSYLIETLGMPESTYREFLDYEAMKNKQDYLKQYQTLKKSNATFYLKIFSVLFSILLFLYLINFAPVFVFLFAILGTVCETRLIRRNSAKSKEHTAASIALFSGFTEGMQLFSSFTMLLSFPMHGLMKGMGQIVTWSIVDETQHTDGMISLFRIYVSENSESFCSCKYKKILGCSCINLNVLKNTVNQIARDMVNLEDGFIDLAYEEYSEKQTFMGISIDKLKSYIRYIADRRLKTMGYEEVFKVKINPLPEFEVMINAPINTNFFENRSTDYAKSCERNWSDVWTNKE